MSVLERTYMSKLVVHDSIGRPLQAGRRYKITQAGRTFWAEVFFDDDGDLVGRRMSDRRTLPVVTWEDAVWELVEGV